ncbi:GNAT family N-acetyltransferase [Brevibacterium jeotgali]|uniref:Acetyltransferase (GNAT) domain-containing protein n=1 Tax=Brevibacterium jeotgali TaxID=1262550 RepID=A0A2H1L5R6_9MICO|nr:GNAT family N-acetyltransferase [Brevibacterium jeotgali]TWB98947.1 acetyltransferase (GNAT) family protein [Brevibacterium jeotgali]SMY12222.1 Acetyltransferase (GNAT) domain-containing protein [Brevibacterium jeotgali]
MAPSTPEKPSTTGSVAIRPWRDGDDRALAQVLPDPGSPAQLAARALLREPGESPLTRTVVAVIDSVVVGAAAIAASPAHPGRAWVHVEVAPEERRRGVGRALLEAAVAEAAGTALDGLGLRTRILADDPVAGAFARAQGFADLFTTRIVLIDAGALGSAGLERAEDLQVIDTGSVALTQAFAGWYERVNALDPAAPMSIGQVNTRFLSEAAGAHGAALWRPDAEDAGADINKRPVTAFAVSYAQKRAEDAEVQAAEASVVPEDDDRVFAVSGGEDATELTIGSVDGGMQDLRSLVARLSVDTPVVVEVTDVMETESALLEELLASGSARILTAYTTLVRDPQG